MVGGERVHADGGIVAGRDLFGVPNDRRTVLLDDQDLGGSSDQWCQGWVARLGPPGFVGRWLHQLVGLGMIFFANVFFCCWCDLLYRVMVWRW